METPPNTIKHAYNIAVGLGDNQSFTVSGNFHKESTLEQMNAEVDMVMKVVERQRARLAIKDKKHEISQSETMVLAQKNDLAMLDKEFEGKVLPSNQKNSRMAIQSNIARFDTLIKQQKAELAELEKVAI